MQNIYVLLVINSNQRVQIHDPDLIVTYEPRKGYSNVRNKAILEIKRNSNIIFVDDDEIPTIAWFNALVAKHHKYPRDIIFGPVLPEPSELKNSYRDKSSNNIKGLKDEDTVKQAGTGNMLIPQELLNEGLIYFDPIFNISGSEDTDLCFMLRKKGIKVRYAKDALIYEVQDKERFSTSYLDTRYIQAIANYSLIIRRHSNYLAIIWRFTTLFYRVLFYSCLSLFIKKYSLKRKAFTKSLCYLIVSKERT